MRHKIEEPDPIDIQIGQRIKALRNLCGVSQRELASVLGLTFQQIQKYERGSNRISASNLYHIAEYLGCRVEHFFYEETSATVPKEHKVITFGKLFSNAPDLVQTAVMRMLKVLSTDQIQDNDPSGEPDERDTLVA